MINTIIPLKLRIEFNETYVLINEKDKIKIVPEIINKILVLTGLTMEEFILGMLLINPDDVILNDLMKSIK